MQMGKSSSFRNSEVESKEVHFDKSLQELKDLRSQLHYAADYCETTFLNTKEKNQVMENTKEYLCTAVVAVVDHLGCLSAKLDSTISKTNAFSEAELRINTLKQRLLSCEQYAHKLALARVGWYPNLPKFHRRYLSTPIVSVDKPDEDTRTASSSLAPAKIMDKQAFEAEDLPLLLYTSSGRFTRKGDSNSAVVSPVRDGFSILSKGPNPTFHFQQTTQKNGRNALFRKSSVHANDILSLIRNRRSKRLTL